MVSHAAIGLAVLGLCSLLHASEPRKIGSPVRVPGLSFRLVTPHPDGDYIAWTTYEGVDRFAMLGVRTGNGRLVWVDTSQYGRTHLRLLGAPDGKSVLIYTGSPGRFLRYTVATGALDDLGAPHSPASYWMGDAPAPDGRWYVGSYPDAALVSCDVTTGEVKDHGRLPDDPKEKYITAQAASDDNIIYCAVGLHHRELWAFDPATGGKCQILPPELTEAQGAPSVWTGEDGNVYGKVGDKAFLCLPDRVEFADSPSPQRRDPDALRAGDRMVVAVDAAGHMKLKTADGGEEAVATDYEGRALQIYSVGCERDGKAYGGTLFPGIAYSYDLADDTLSDLGAPSHGAIQIYDIASVPKGLYLASYMGCKLDYFDPSAPRAAGTNPRSIKGSIPGHERPNQWELGPDGKLYFGTTPAKGRLGGALVCVDPADDSVRAWNNIIKDQSISYLTAVPQTGELFGCCTVGGGSSAIATEKEAFVFLWDVAKEQVAWQGRPIEGTRSYSRAVRAANGLLYGVAEGRYYVLDPARREVVAGGELPVKALHFPTLNDRPAGPRGLIYGLGDDAVFAVNPADNSVSIVGRHPSIATAHGFLVTEGNVLLYGSGADLWRWDLPDQ